MSALSIGPTVLLGLVMLGLVRRLWEKKRINGGVKAFVDKVLRLKIRVVVFDMDQCFVAKHSRGRLQKSEMLGFCGAVTPSFKRVVPALVDAGIKIAIATHSDGIEHDASKPRTLFIIGMELAAAVLQIVVPEYTSQFYIVAFNQRRRSKITYDVRLHGEAADMAAPLNRLEKRISKERLKTLLSKHNKQLHMHLIAEHFGVPVQQMVLFDDDGQNVSQCGEGNSRFTAVQVDPRCGFALVDFLRKQEDTNSSQ